MTHLRALLGLLLATLAAAQTPAARDILNAVDSRADRFGQISRQIWENPEVGWDTPKSAGLLKEALRGAGFRLKEDIGGIPSAFVAEWGSGKPVIGIIGEYDALPGLSQDVVGQRSPVVQGGPGHGCGHNLFGTASALAAIAVKEHLAAAKLAGTIRFYGTPYEEGGAGKVYMLRAGAFADLDVALGWHPYDRNVADDNSWLANLSAQVRFYGKAAHAAGSPDAGRSALDGVELMTHAINMLREHVPQETRMHYIITNGGAAANIVPDFASAHVIVRHPDQQVLAGLWQRVQDCARAGALATGTRVEIEITSGYSNFVTNSVLRDLIDKNLHTVGGVTYTAEEKQFAAQLQKTLERPDVPALELAAEVLPPNAKLLSASSDVGDVSWNVPTGHLLAATFVPGLALHTWQSTACAGSSIGRKGMLVAAKTLALTAGDLFHEPAAVARARAVFEAKMKGKHYETLIPAERKPGLSAH